MPANQQLDTEQATHRTTTIWVIVAPGLFVGFAVFDRTYIAPFSTVVGQDRWLARACALAVRIDPGGGLVVAGQRPSSGEAIVKGRRRASTSSISMFVQAGRFVFSTCHRIYLTDLSFSFGPPEADALGRLVAVAPVACRHQIFPYPLICMT